MSENFQERTIKVKQRTGLALALSGGGYRATLFHLGLLRRLNEVGLLKEVDAISSVSGGSITSALLAKNFSWKKKTLSTSDWNRTIRDPLVTLCKIDIRTMPILKSLARFWKSGVAVSKTEENYRRLLTDQTLGDLPEEVDFIFCASDLVFSTIWYYRRKTSSSRRTGNHRAGWLKEWEDIPVARAVAASSCFPPVFGPQPLNKIAHDFQKPSNPNEAWPEQVSKIRLTDGGVYDNLGLEPVWRQYKGVICSDGGKPSVFKATSGVGNLARYSDLIQEQVANLRQRMLIQRANSEELDFATLYSGIEKSDKANGYSKAFVSDIISNIRTDLDGFTESEARVLENHGYTLTDHYLKRFTSEEPWKSQIDQEAFANPQVPFPDEMDEEKMRHELRRSSKRSILFFTPKRKL
ncbi:patatin-like phospholipase family protein [Akkermansiaceae bacterium]|nr:patatin-like phospholipase family protein [Akkermansiaceae bacterium]MDB4538267.1 patatin-like phospholipase family protein [Akkermansiaceae bacterium]